MRQPARIVLPTMHAGAMKAWRRKDDHAGSSFKVQCVDCFSKAYSDPSAFSFLGVSLLCELTCFRIKLDLFN